MRAHAGVNALEGVGMIEAPRGSLIHHYKVDEDGAIIWANLIVATGHNNLAINRGIKQVAQHFVDGNQIKEGMLNRVSAVVRAYDPCLSCSTHALGMVPMVMQLRGPDGHAAGRGGDGLARRRTDICSGGRPGRVGDRGSRSPRRVQSVEEIVRPGGLALLATRRLRADRTVAVLAGLLLVAAAALPATGALYADRAALAGLRSSFGAAAPADRSVRVAIDAPVEEVVDVDPAISTEVGATAGTPAIRVIRSNGLVVDGTPARTLAVVGSFDDIAAHATLVDGAWARPGQSPADATLSVGAATALGLRVGDLVTLRDPIDGRRSVALRLAGTWRPDPSDPYWEADPLDLTGSQTVRLTTQGPFVMAHDDLVAALPGSSVHAEWRGFPAAAELTPEASDSIRVNIERLPGRVQAAVRPDRAVTVTTGLPVLLARLAQAGLVGRQTILLLVGQLVVLAVYALVLVGGVVAARRRQEDALLRERGGTGGHLARTALIEGLILGVPAAIAAIAIAGSGAGWLVGVTVGAAPGMPTGVDLTTVGIAVLAAIVGAAALTAPSMRPGSSLHTLRTAIGRRVGRTFGQRLGLDTILIVLGVIAIWQLRSYGTSLAAGAGVAGGASAAGGATAGTGRSVDLVLVLAPALGLVAGAAVVIRLVPRIAEIAERGLGGLRGLILPLGGREIARRPQRSTRIALLVVLAAALGTLAATHAATWTQSQDDQAAYAVPSDVRVLAGPVAALPGWLAAPAYRAVLGVSGATPVLVRGVDAGPAAGAQLLAVDAAAADALAAGPGAPASLAARRRDLALLSAAMPGDGGIAIPDGTRRLAVTVDAGLRAGGPEPGAGPNDVALPGVDVRLVLRDASGRISRVEAGRAAPSGSTTLEVPLARRLAGTGGPGTSPTSQASAATPLAPDPGLRLIGVEVAVPTPADAVAVGRIDLEAVRATSTDAAAADTGTTPTGSTDTWADLAVAPAASGWTWTRLEDARASPYQPPPASWGRLFIGASPGPDGPAGTSRLPTRFELAPAPSTSVPVPAMVNDAFLDATGAVARRHARRQHDRRRRAPAGGRGQRPVSSARPDAPVRRGGPPVVRAGAVVVRRHAGRSRRVVADDRCRRGHEHRRSHRHPHGRPVPGAERGREVGGGGGLGRRPDLPGRHRSPGSRRVRGPRVLHTGLHRPRGDLDSRDRR